MRKRLVIALTAVMFLPGLFGAARLCAQATQEVVLDSSAERWQGRPFVLSLHGRYTENGRWEGSSRLTEYARMHKGETFLVFEQDGLLYRLDKPEDMRKLTDLSLPMEHLADLQSALAASMAPLSTQQAALGASMEPLSTQQAALGAQMRATRDTRSMGRIGQEQGAVGRRQGQIGREQGVIGREQGKIGREQGVIGREQGILGRLLYQSGQEMIDRCLQEKICSAVAPAPPATAQR